jgi:hypothetical protein
MTPILHSLKKYSNVATEKSEANARCMEMPVIPDNKVVNKYIII